MSGQVIEGPALTVVLAALADAAVLETTLLHLRAQTVRDRIELVVVTPSRERLGPLPTAMDALHGCRVIEAPAATSVAQANAAGVRVASAPVVAFVEDHSFPDRGWAEALVRAHEDDWVAVGPVVVNANPGTILSWADFLIGFGRWMEPTPAGPQPFLPGHNCSYKRSALLAFGDELESVLEVETVLHLHLAAAGGGLYLEPAARVAHTNFSRWRPSLHVRFHSGRAFAARLRDGWHRPRRVVFALASPLIPLVRFARCVAQMTRPGRAARIRWSVLPALAFSLLVDGAGQVAGHVAGPGDSEKRLAAYEFRRIDEITSSDRRAIAALTATLRSSEG